MEKPKKRRLAGTEETSDGFDPHQGAGTTGELDRRKTLKGKERILSRKEPDSRPCENIRGPAFIGGLRGRGKAHRT